MKIGASEGIRTLDINLGKVALYQTELRSLPEKAGGIYGIRRQMQGFILGFRGQSAIGAVCCISQALKPGAVLPEPGYETPRSLMKYPG